MSEPASLSRRRLLALFSGLAGLGSAASRVLGGPRDQGIGGTGLTYGDDEGDRGIGGTGVIGTIRRFGSILVNELKIAYPPDVAVNVDGAAAPVSSLKIGQVVRVVAIRDASGYSTRAINVTSEVVGPVHSVDGATMTVLGQSVSLASLPKSARRWRRGDHVAVSGLRRPDGMIVATLIEARPVRVEQIAGPVDVASDGALAIGGTKLSGLDPVLVGQRAVLQGQWTNGVFAVSHGASERLLFGGGVSRLSVEAYVERGANGLRLGSGLPVSGDADWLPMNQPVRAVLDSAVGSGGVWRVDTIRLDRGGSLEPGRGASPFGGRAPGQTGGGQGRPGPGGAGQGGSGGVHEGFGAPGSGGGFGGQGAAPRGGPGGAPVAPPGLGPQPPAAPFGGGFGAPAFPGVGGATGGFEGPGPSGFGAPGGGIRR